MKIPDEAKLTLENIACLADLRSTSLGDLGHLQLVANAQLAKAAPIIEAQFYEWGDSLCPHVHSVLPNRPRRACDICWETLKGDYILESSLGCGRIEAWIRKRVYGQLFKSSLLVL